MGEGENYLNLDNIFINNENFSLPTVFRVYIKLKKMPMQFKIAKSPKKVLIRCKHLSFDLFG